MNSSDIKKAFDQIYQAMLDRISKELGNFLSDEFTLTHMSGKVQSKKDWLKNIDSGLRVYHSRKEVSNQITLSKEGATLTGWD